MSGTDPAALTPDAIVAYLGEIFERRGGEEYLGEAVTMAEHMLQAAKLAEDAGADEAIIVAALLHDIGHFTGALGGFTMEDVEDRHHEEAGAAILARFFPPIVVDCVRHHVAAKRYLCATRPDYFERLSAASRRSLSLQGGPMSGGQVAEFERNPHWRAIVQVRLLDDAGKRAGMATPPFAHYAPMAQRVVDAHCGGEGARA